LKVSPPFSPFFFFSECADAPAAAALISAAPTGVRTDQVPAHHDLSDAWPCRAGPDGRGRGDVCVTVLDSQRNSLGDGRLDMACPPRLASCYGIRRKTLVLLPKVLAFGTLFGVSLGGPRIRGRDSEPLCSGFPDVVRAVPLESIPDDYRNFSRPIWWAGYLRPGPRTRHRTFSLMFFCAAQTGSCRLPGSFTQAIDVHFSMGACFALV